MALNAHQSVALLSIGLVFSVATQLRLPNLPLGLGELLLLAWMFLSSGKPSSWRSLQLLAIAWLVVFGTILLVLGYMETYPADHVRPAALHDVVAYSFCAALAINFARLKAAGAERMPAAFLMSFAVSFIVALLFGWAAENWMGKNVLFHAERWQHLSVNPNQFALLALAVPFLAIHLVLRQTDTPWLALAIALLGVALGFFSQSDALSIAWLAGGIVACACLLGSHDIKRNRIVVVLIALMLGAGGWQLSSKVADIVTPTPTPTFLACHVEHFGGEEHQANVRFCLWRHALEAIGKRPWTGWGPGAHSGISAPFLQTEAHNAWLDWATQTGLLGMLALTVYMLWMFFQLLGNGRYELLALFVALLSFSMFHHTLRQPLFWLLPLIVLRLSEYPVKRTQWGSGPSDHVKSCAG